MKQYITSEISKARDVIDQVLSNEHYISTIEQISLQCINALRRGNRVLFAGNGGSAADAQHLAAEFVSRFAFDRPGLPAIALTTDSSILTAIGNDYGYEQIFSRQIEANGVEGDVFIAISTSGNSKNILGALRTAGKRDLVTVGLSGQTGGGMPGLCEHILLVPSEETPKIQEIHIMVGHIICGLVEKSLYASEYQ